MINRFGLDYYLEWFMKPYDLFATELGVPRANPPLPLSAERALLGASVFFLCPDTIFLLSV